MTDSEDLDQTALEAVLAQMDKARAWHANGFLQKPHWLHIDSVNSILWRAFSAETDDPTPQESNTEAILAKQAFMARLGLDPNDDPFLRP